MNRIVAALISLLFASSSAAQSDAYAPKELPPAAKTPRVRIAQGPELESAEENSAIIRWTTNNPGGSEEHYAVIHYGTDPKYLNQTAKSHIRLNQNHPDTIFRVMVVGLAPRTTYYYTVDSMEATGESDGLKSNVARFTTRGPGERIAAAP
jgi:PhoPQ-activated pathogenicity-related protein